MSIENSILLEIFNKTPFISVESNLIADKFEAIHLKKGDIILDENEIVYNQYYVSDGCLRAFFIDFTGKEHTIQFAVKDWWISDYTAFFSTTKAIMSIECIQNAILYKISREDLENLYQESPLIETFFRKKLENAFSSFQKRILGNLSQPAKERYLTFINTYPNIEQNVKNYHIASYLGITTESLSRIRKEIAQE